MAKTDKKEKISAKRIISNYVYVLRYAAGKDFKLIIAIFLAYVLSGMGYSCMDTIFLRAFINFLSDDAYSFKYVAVVISFATIGIALCMAVERFTESFARPGIIKMTGMMQEEMIHKVVKMDLMCYDCDSYYDDFVVAASQLEEMVVTAVFDLARMGRNISVVIVLSGLMTFINPAIAIFPVIGFLVNIVSRFRIMRLEYELDVEKKKIMRRADYSKRVFYQPEYAKEIKLSHIEIPLENQFHKAIDETIEVSKKYGVKISLWSLVNWIIVFTFLSFFCAPLYLGYLALVKMSIRLGDVAALNNAQADVRSYLDSLNYCVERIQRVGQYAERFRKFMDYESTIEEAEGTKDIPNEKSIINIKDMSFRYDGAEKDTLKHINMTIKPGEKIALVGENGAGKSTFVKLLMRLYDVTEGTISYGGNDIRDYETKQYRDIFGTVFQDYQMYATSIFDNVMMYKTDIDSIGDDNYKNEYINKANAEGKSEDKQKTEYGNRVKAENKSEDKQKTKYRNKVKAESKSESKIKAESKLKNNLETEYSIALDALDKAGFTERLATLSDGLLTMLTREFEENGVSLSGGEAQKVAIARLFAKRQHMHIAILDEPSSALDPKAEYELNRNLLNRAGDATVIFISHRLSTTRDADRIYMFENGQIVEQGTHDELMQLNGQYADMFNCQAQYYQQNEKVFA